MSSKKMADGEVIIKVVKIGEEEVGFEFGGAGNDILTAYTLLTIKLAKEMEFTFRKFQDFIFKVFRGVVEKELVDKPEPGDDFYKIEWRN